MSLSRLMMSSKRYGTWRTKSEGFHLRRPRVRLPVHAGRPDDMDCLPVHAVVPTTGARVCCEAWWAGSWAQSANRFSACERDRGECRVMNATILGVAFTLPLFGGLRLHGCHMSLVGWSADVGLGKVTVT
ncbi:hypothetical protein Taro_043196 [Colocasia esculenta]|uniref:Uncharacterized protein n=1 Tax=Colocasia esculenta TaxID=4460 RepID=A0A843WIS8_COLES|nr:hypothetical protein [Colocasia esculenta]